MFSSFKDFQRIKKIKFDTQSEKSFENFEKEWQEVLETESSIELSASDQRKIVETDAFWKSVGELISTTENLMTLWFLKTVEEEDLFPGTIKLFITQQKDEIKKLNCRKSDPKFVERVLNRFEEGPNGKTVLKSLLKKLINLLKTNGVHNEKDQLVLNEKNLREASKISAAKFEKVIKYGIKASCLKKEERKGKSRIILISEDIQEDENEGNKKIAKLMFKIMKASGVYNEKEQRVCNETIVRSKLKSSDEDFSLALEYCVKEGCLRIYEIKNVKFIILLKEELSGEINVEESNEEMAWRVIKCIKDSKEETEEGYLCMPVSKILERLEINKKRLNEIVKQGEKKELLKFENVNVVYTQERRLQVKNL